MLLPFGSNAKIDSQKASSEPLITTSVEKNQRINSIENALERSKMPRFLKKYVKKRLYTEGGLNKSPKGISASAQRFFTTLLLVLAGVLLVYWLQGTLALLFAVIGIVSYWRNRDRIADWQRRRYERLYNNPEVATTTDSYARDSQGRTTSSLGHAANKWTRRALTRFIIGVGLTFLVLVISILTLFTSGAGTIIFLKIMTLIGFIFTLISVVNAFQAIIDGEPQSVWGWLVLLLGIPFLLTLLAILAFAFGG